MYTINLIQDAYPDSVGGEPCYRASGYLATESVDDETGPTVTVLWLGDDADAIDWATPESIEHYLLGDITDQATIN